MPQPRSTHAGIASQPPTSIRKELDAAIRAGIRRGGADAVQLVLVGMARSIVVVSTFGALCAVAALSGYDPSTPHFAGIAGAAALLNWFAAGKAFRA